MAYHEIPLAKLGHKIQIGPRHGDVYDIDALGQDDGASPDPDAAFRLLLQLGQGLMVYVYVVGMARPHDPRGFHSFWLKDCAVSHVDMEEWGPPAHVQADSIALPPVFKKVAVGPASKAEVFDVERIELASRPAEANAPDLDIRWELRGANGREAQLRYMSANGAWTLTGGPECRPLGPQDRIVFSGPR